MVEKAPYFSNAQRNYLIVQFFFFLFSFVASRNSFVTFIIIIPLFRLPPFLLVSLKGDAGCNAQEKNSFFFIVVLAANPAFGGGGREREREDKKVR